MHIKSEGCSHLVDGIWVTPDGPPTEIADADWPLYQNLPGVVQVDAPSLAEPEPEFQGIGAATTPNPAVTPS